jgi:Ca2+-binding RTX toxin-like protein
MATNGYANTNTVSVWLNDGHGNFTAGGSFPAGSGAAWGSLIDLNRDGKLDAIVSDEGAPTVAVLFGDGMGGFSAPTFYTRTATVYMNNAADLNGDGLPEMLWANAEKGDISVFPNTSTATQVNPVTLVGTPANDILKAGSGDDQLNVLFGNDTLTGGSGADHFVFSTMLDARSNVDTITDFAHGLDKIVLDHSVFSGLPAGALNPNAFTLVGAETAGPQVAYNPSSGALYYDADGLGGSEAIQFATLIGTPNLSSADFLII